MVREELARCGVPRRHAQKAELRRQPGWAGALGEAARLCARKGAVVALLGPRGTGKTQIAAELLRAAVADRRSVRYGTAVELFLDVRAAMGARNRTEADAVADWCRPSLLVIDELQERKGTGFEAGLLAAVVDRRYGALRDTVLVANADRAGFEALAGDGIVSRLNETGGIIRCDWPSFRG